MENTDSGSEITSGSEPPAGENSPETTPPLKTDLPFVAKLTVVLMLVGAGASIVEMVYSPLMLDIGHINFTPLITIPLAYGLLCHSEAARGCLVSLAMLTMVCVAILLPFYSIAYLGPWDLEWEVAGSPLKEASTGYFLGGLLMLVLLLGFTAWTWFALSGHRSKAIFRQKTSHQDALSWTLALLVMGVLVGIGHAGTDYQYRQQEQSLHYLDATIHIIDAQTGERLDGYVASDQSLLPTKGDSPVNKLTTGMGRDTFYLSGIVDSPVEYGFTVEGYQPRTVTIRPGVSEITVEMVPGE